MRTSFRAFPVVTVPPLPSLGPTASFPARFPSLPQRRLCKFGVKCSYAEAGISDDSRSATIDVVADVRNERIVVLGGSGFVGSAICKAAVSKGIEVISLSRSGRPTYSGSWVDQVNWVPGDVFYANWDEVLVGATAVVSTLGGFGSEEQMKRINGEANVVAVNAAKDFGIPKFILISVHDYNLPSFLLSSGYFTGKRKAESEVLSKYPNSGLSSTHPIYLMAIDLPQLSTIEHRPNLSPPELTQSLLPCSVVDVDNAFFLALFFLLMNFDRQFLACTLIRLRARMELT
ncbi:uncharacterized protein At1g32220, chloroplastic isoform X2 [Gossypium hirsutum]|uniref:Uncharacterized protein At1g32220, chloroplastic isoform X2 n=1 Tax=Gossypium hirsutum TaxID=3635 RepID=A0A1U8LX11_GOSHI|nr:uncharacterized protein At1g32220, chloroplastic isoform X2 [Gossypium hirsutum]